MNKKVIVSVLAGALAIAVGNGLYDWYKKRSVNTAA